MENNNSIVDLIGSKNATKFIKINNIIIKSKYKNIDIIMANESLSTVSALLNTVYSDKEKYLLSDIIYQSNENIFNSYDYVLIDYPPTINELSVSFLIDFLHNLLK
ncbi:MAG: ParA family protein [Spiroplasma sp. hy2]|uniref:ParA family protein n=1 Tax=Spiroplasma sp. hy2 TaxID=2490850 RepID=UPI003842F5ED